MGVLGVGGASERRPTSNHVERKPSASLSFVPATGESNVCVNKSIVVTRPVPLSVVLTSVMGPCSLSAETMVLPVPCPGAQSWKGEIVSNGSGTDTRYGTAVPTQSAADSVTPPDVDEKYVVAILPPNMSTWPFVASTAALLAGSSCERPRYIWLRVSLKTSYGAPTWRVAIAYDRAATACAFSASLDQFGGISAGTTP